MTNTFYDAMSALKGLYGLGFTHNPGGGSFSHSEATTNCQITIQNEKDDFIRLVSWLRQNGAQIEADITKASSKMRNDITTAMEEL